MSPVANKGSNTVDGRNPAPPKTPWNDDSLVNTNKQWLPMVSKWCRILSIHSMGAPMQNTSSPLAHIGQSKTSSCSAPADFFSGPSLVPPLKVTDS